VLYTRGDNAPAVARQVERGFIFGEDQIKEMNDGRFDAAFQLLAKRSGVLS
jgi:hypothetical protein